MVRGRIFVLGIALAGTLTVAVQAYRAPADRALLRAVESGNLASASVLLREGANPNVRDHTPYRSCTNPAPPPMHRPALTFAVQNMDLEMVELLLSHGADPNGTETSGYSGMVCAAYRNHVAILRALVRAGGNVSLQQGSVEAPLGPQMLLRHTAAGDWLAAHGARMLPRNDPSENAYSKTHYLAQFSSQRDQAEAERAKAAPLTRDDWLLGSNPLVEAARVGGVTELRRLLDQGADVNAKDSAGKTALMVALSYGCRGRLMTCAYQHNPQVAINRRREMARLLLEPRYGLRITGGTEVRAVFHAAATGDDATLRALIAAGGDANATSAGGFTALMAGVSSGNVAVMDQLLLAGANPNAVCGRGWTAGAWLDMPGYPAYYRLPSVIFSQSKRRVETL